MKPGEKFKTEAELCAAFIPWAEKQGWRAYPETAGWDILLVRGDGYQIGVQAKLRLNAEVVVQAMEDRYRPWGPDFRAVLVPSPANGALTSICAALKITTVQFSIERWKSGPRPFVRPDLPKIGEQHFEWNDWHELCPAERCTVPEYVPDVAAGAKSPVQLTDWKIRAIRLAVLLKRNGAVTRQDFKHLGLDHRRFTDFWLERTPNGFVNGGSFPDFQKMHPRNYAEIEADFEKWAPRGLL
jgi:hypothetical protein